MLQNEKGDYQNDHALEARANLEGVGKLLQYVVFDLKDLDQTCKFRHANQLVNLSHSCETS